MGRCSGMFIKRGLKFDHRLLEVLVLVVDGLMVGRFWQLFGHLEMLGSIQW